MIRRKGKLFQLFYPEKCEKIAITKDIYLKKRFTHRLPC